MILFFFPVNEGACAEMARDFYLYYMLTLFDELPILPEGFHYYPDFIDEQQEQQLMAAIQEIDLQAMVFHNYTAKRKVASFAYDYSFSTRKLTKGAAIPESFNWVIDRAAEQLLVSRDQIVELLSLISAIPSPYAH